MREEGGTGRSTSPLLRRRTVLKGALGVAGALPVARRARAARALRLAHGLPHAHPVHQAMEHFADLVRERTDGGIVIHIFADGMFGQEPSLLEQVKAGTLDFTKASASVLEGVSARYRVFDLPFLFRDKAHWRAVVGGSIGRDMLAPAAPGGIVGLTYYDAGARSFYGRQPIGHPDDLKGLRIRVQLSATTIRMVELLGAEAVPLPWRNVFSALQTGLVDGAENNVTALIHGRHAEVARYYAFTEHTMVPDVLLVAHQTWTELTARQREIVLSAANESYLVQIELWRAAEAQSRAEAERLGVIFQHPDKAPFMARVAPLTSAMRKDEAMAALIRRIEATG